MSATALAPFESEARIKLAAAEANLGDYSNALSELALAEKIPSGNAARFYALAEGYRLTKDPWKALARPLPTLPSLSPYQRPNLRADRGR